MWNAKDIVSSKWCDFGHYCLFPLSYYNGEGIYIIIYFDNNDLPFFVLINTVQKCVSIVIKVLFWFILLSIKHTIILVIVIYNASLSTL